MFDNSFQTVGNLIGNDADAVKLIFMLLLSYPLSHIYTRLPTTTTSSNIRHYFSIIISLFYGIGLFDMYWGMTQLIGDSILVWGICKSGIGKGQGWMPWLVFGLIMGHLLINHIYREIFATTVPMIEITSPQMVLVMKLITFAWEIEDGRTDVKLLDSEQTATRQTKIPSLLEFLGYTLFFPSLITGPASDYATYDRLTAGTLFSHPPEVNESSKKASDAGSAQERKNQSVIVPKGRKSAGYTRLSIGLICLGIYATQSGAYSHQRIIKEGDWWNEKNFLGKFNFVQLASAVARTKYYFLWCLAEGSCIITGIGFNGHSPSTNKPLWNRIRNVEIWGIESAQSYKVLFDSWNCRANVWLRDTVYKRVTPRGKKPGMAGTLLTFVTSAFWHGIAPGYYMAFITAGFCTSLGRPFRHLVRPFFLPANGAPSSPLKKLYDVLGWCFVQITLNYIVSAFLLLKFKDCILAWSRMGWYGHIIIVSAVLFFRFGGKEFIAGLNGKAGNKVKVSKAEGVVTGNPKKEL